MTAARWPSSDLIDEVKRDMERPVPMDRLICGDVGYGKTEIAVRAAFKAVHDGSQVAVLRSDRRSEAGHGAAGADGPADLRGRRLRQDRDRGPRGVQGGPGRQPGGRP